MNELLFELSDVYMEKFDENVPIFDSSLLLGDICMNRIAGIAHKNICKLKNIQVQKEFKTTIADVYEGNINKNKLFRRNIKYLSKILKDVNFNYALLKGAFLTTKLYENGIRTSNDIDILINEANITECQSLLISNGFIQGEFKSDVGIVPATRREILTSRMNYGETVPFVKMIEGEPLYIDLNFSVDFKPESENQLVSELLMNTVEVEFEDVSFKTLKVEDFLIHLCCHLYKEATTINWVRENRDLQLYKFSDINVFLHELITSENITNLVERIKEFGVEKECYYALKNTSTIYNKLSKTEKIEKILNEIRPKDTKFMKQIYDPTDKKYYEYNMTFEEWFKCKMKMEKLKSVEGAANEF